MNRDECGLHAGLEERRAQRQLLVDISGVPNSNDYQQVARIGTEARVGDANAPRMRAGAALWSCRNALKTPRRRYHGLSVRTKTANNARLNFQARERPSPSCGLCGSTLDSRRSRPEAVPADMSSGLAFWRVCGDDGESEKFVANSNGCLRRSR